jgi:hypothetical protein
MNVVGWSKDRLQLLGFNFAAVSKGGTGHQIPGTYSARTSETRHRSLHGREKRTLYSELNGVGHFWLGGNSSARVANFFRFLFRFLPGCFSVASSVGTFQFFAAYPIPIEMPAIMGK